MILIDIFKTPLQFSVRLLRHLHNIVKLIESTHFNYYNKRPSGFLRIKLYNLMGNTGVK